MIRPDRIHLHARKLYHNLSLPSLPAVNVTAIGNELLRRLKLPGLFTVHFAPVFYIAYVQGSFQGCLKKLLLLYPLDANSGLVTPHHTAFERTEVECMAVIVVLLKMLYRLDDQYEVSVPSIISFVCMLHTHIINHKYHM